MRNYLTRIGAALALALAASPTMADTSQLAAHAGYSPEEAAELSLAELNAAKRSRNATQDERIVMVVGGGTPSPAALDQLARHSRIDPADATLAELLAAKLGRNTGDDQRVSFVSTRGMPRPEALRQITAHSGLSPEEAADYSLQEIVVLKYNRAASGDNRIGLRR